VALPGEGRGTERDVMGKPEGKRPFGRLRKKCENWSLGSRMEYLDLTDLSWNRGGSLTLVNAIINLLVL
jgi:hypothetical protein